MWDMWNGLLSVQGVFMFNISELQALDLTQAAESTPLVNKHALDVCIIVYIALGSVEQLSLYQE
jgi:hypothetical protein